MYPNVANRVGYTYLEYGLLQIFDAVPEREIRQPTQRNARDDPVMPVIRSGLLLSQLLAGRRSQIRRSPLQLYDIDFTSLETTIVAYSGRGAFSGGGDSAQSSSTGRAVSSPCSPAAA